MRIYLPSLPIEMQVDLQNQQNMPIELQIEDANRSADRLAESAPIEMQIDLPSQHNMPIEIRIDLQCISKFISDTNTTPYPTPTSLTTVPTSANIQHISTSYALLIVDKEIRDRKPHPWSNPHTTPTFTLDCIILHYYGTQHDNYAIQQVTIYALKIFDPVFVKSLLGRLLLGRSARSLLDSAMLDSGISAAI